MAEFSTISLHEQIEAGIKERIHRDKVFGQVAIVADEARVAANEYASVGYGGGSITVDNLRRDSLPPIVV